MPCFKVFQRASISAVRINFNSFRAAQFLKLIREGKGFQSSIQLRVPNTRKWSKMGKSRILLGDASSPNHVKYSNSLRRFPVKSKSEKGLWGCSTSRCSSKRSFCKILWKGSYRYLPLKQILPLLDVPSGES